MNRLLSTLTGVFMVGLMGSAQAGDPIILGNAQMDTVTAAGQYSRTDVYFNFNAHKNIRADVYERVLWDVYGRGNNSEAMAGAYASGHNTDTKTFTDSQVFQGFGSVASSLSTAAAAPAYYGYCCKKP